MNITVPMSEQTKAQLLGVIKTAMKSHGVENAALEKELSFVVQYLVSLTTNEATKQLQAGITKALELLVESCKTRQEYEQKVAKITKAMTG